MNATVQSPLATLVETRDRFADLLVRANQFLVQNGEASISVPTHSPLLLVLRGEYNAGKSTLLNALLGQDMAAMGSAPTTHDVKEYQYRSCKILDVPGTNADALDAKLALEATRTAHAVIYVVSSQSGCDYKELWNDLDYLTKNNFPWLLVINDKQPHHNSEDARHFRQHLVNYAVSTAQKRLGIPDAERRVFCVNAEEARKARLKDSNTEALIDSGIIPFETTLCSMLHKNDILLREKHCLRTVEDALQRILSHCASRLATPGAQKIHKLLQLCEIARVRLVTILDSTITDLEKYFTSVMHTADLCIRDKTWPRRFASCMATEVEQIVRNFDVQAGPILEDLQRKVTEVGLRVAAGQRKLRDLVPRPSVDFLPIASELPLHHDDGPGSRPWKYIGLAPLIKSVFQPARTSLLSRFSAGGSFGRFLGMAMPVVPLGCMLLELLFAYRSAQQRRKEAKAYARANVEAILQMMEHTLGGVRKCGMAFIDEQMRCFIDTLTEKLRVCEEEDHATRDTFHQAQRLLNEVHEYASTLAV
ncbi:MAG: hypothetical protein KatS3mg110_3196 [Pirellulaceae bacterium]|nr:MAG: hypothetical protein KatS3mg110_3196 [Pirellulaceae bacterium]